MANIPTLRELGLTFLELDKFIEDEEVQVFVVEALLYTKEDFFYQPASSTGKYHPEYALGVGGLLRHTKAALIIAKELFNVYDFTPGQQDDIMAAITLHDIEKPSKLHPVEVKLRLEPLRDTYPEIFEDVIPLIESHMGVWDQYGKLPKPKTLSQHFVHLVDFLASRKCIKVDMGMD